MIERKTDYLRKMESDNVSDQIELDQHDQQYQGQNALQGESDVKDKKDRVGVLKEELEKDKQMALPGFFRVQVREYPVPAQAVCRCEGAIRTGVGR
ncbi:MAG: hypothetical protein MZV63_30725 [Marinilabiliales bacterium]|nr:hypothetical protein [Marinilabiliales bacterium]